MSGDLSGLAAMCPPLKDTEKQMRGVVDLLTVDKEVRRSSWLWESCVSCACPWITAGRSERCLCPVGHGERLNE